jgi:hypothetical protein
MAYLKRDVSEDFKGTVLAVEHKCGSDLGTNEKMDSPDCERHTMDAI